MPEKEASRLIMMMSQPNLRVVVVNIVVVVFIFLAAHIGLRYC